MWAIRGFRNQQFSSPIRSENSGIRASLRDVLLTFLNIYLQNTLFIKTQISQHGVANFLLLRADDFVIIPYQLSFRGKGEETEEESKGWCVMSLANRVAINVGTYLTNRWSSVLKQSRGSTKCTVNSSLSAQLRGFVNDCIKFGHARVAIKGQERICISAENNNRASRLSRRDIEVPCY